MRFTPLLPARSRAFPLLAAAALGCSATGEGSFFTGAGGSSASATGTGSAGGATGTGGAAGPSGVGGNPDLGLGGSGAGVGGSPGGTDPGCNAASQFVYTLAADNSLFKFDPPTLTFTLIGVVNCPSGSTPYSMAVDRDANAWSISTDGSLVKIDTKTAACTPTSFVTSQQQGFFTFGMGFSANAPGSKDETLFVSSSAPINGLANAPFGLAKIDLTTLKLVVVGAYDKPVGRAEMTGTGDGKLFGAFEGKPYVVSEVDKAAAKILTQAPQTPVNYPPNSSNFAFAAWGGDFWLFAGPGTFTDVFQYKPSTGVTAKVKTVPNVIVGAGVSTCAPTKPPS